MGFDGGGDGVSVVFAGDGGYVYTYLAFLRELN